jgi:hypothetical protein
MSSVVIPPSDVEVMPREVALRALHNHANEYQPLPLSLRASVALRTVVRALEVRWGHPVLILACRVHDAAEDLRQADEDLSRWADDGGAS